MSEDVDDFGWDKAAALQDKRRREREANIPPSLQPRYPWTMIAFDPDFFEADPPGEEN